MRNTIRNILNRCGYELVKKSEKKPYLDLESAFMDLYEICKPFTMTSVERMYALYKAIEYIAKKKIAGDLVECGTWRGGSAMMMLLTLMKWGDTSRNVFLYDTYEGMSAPTEKDINYSGEKAEKLLRESIADKENSVWCLASLEDVKKNIGTIKYPAEQIHFIKGKVEDTIPQTMPSKISLLRLDTDWYESTYHELKYLYPLLIQNGVLIIDDYGHWKGAREATDQYFNDQKEIILLNRIDYTGRIAIKQ